MPGRFCCAFYGSTGLALRRLRDQRSSPGFSPKGCGGCSADFGSISAGEWTCGAMAVPPAAVSYDYLLAIFGGPKSPRHTLPGRFFSGRMPVHVHPRRPLFRRRRFVGWQSAPWCPPSSRWSAVGALAALVPLARGCRPTRSDGSHRTAPTLRRRGGFRHARTWADDLPNPMDPASPPDSAFAATADLRSPQCGP